MADDRLWEAAEFYTKPGKYGDIALGPVAHAITGDSAVMRLGAVEDVPDIRFLTITAAQYDALLAGIEAGFSKVADGQRILADALELGLTDAFFVAEETFNAYYT